MSDLLASIKSHLKERPEQAKLTQLSLLKALPPGDVQDTIRALYPDKDLNGWFLGRILNSIFTQKRGVFLFSKRILEDLLKRDKNRSKRRSVSGTEYKELMVNLDKVFFERLAHGKNGEHRAAVYQLVHPQLLALLKMYVSEAVLEGQRAQCLEIFNSYGEKSEDSSRKTSRAFASANESARESERHAFGDTPSHHFSKREKAKGEKSDSLAYDQTNDPDFDPDAPWRKTIMQLNTEYFVWFKKYPIEGDGWKSFETDFITFVEDNRIAGIPDRWPPRELVMAQISILLKRRFSGNDRKPEWSFNGNICQGLINRVTDHFDRIAKDRPVDPGPTESFYNQERRLAGLPPELDLKEANQPLSDEDAEFLRALEIPES